MNDKIKRTESNLFRANCWLRCLTAKLDRIEPEEFEQHMELIEKVKADIEKIGKDLIVLRMSCAEYAEYNP